MIYKTLHRQLKVTTRTQLKQRVDICAINACFNQLFLFISGQPGGKGAQGPSGSPGPQGKHNTNS